MRVHDVEWHLNGVEPESVLAGNRERVQVDVGILVAGEADVADLAGRPRIDERGIRTVLVEHAVRILVADHFVVLHEIDGVNAEPAQ